MEFLAKGDIARIPEVVDVDAYTENCVGLTPGWVHGFEAALQNYLRVVAPAFSEMSVELLETLEQGALATVRQRISARHTGELLGVPPTGRRVTYEALDMVRIERGRIVWRWLLINLWGLVKLLRGEP